MENATDQLSGQTALRSDSGDALEMLHQHGPYEHSLIGEYTRMLLLLLVVPLLVWLAQLGTRQQISLTTLSAAIVLLTSLLTAKGNLWFRVFLLAAMAFNLLAAVINPNNTWGGQDIETPLTIPNLILMACCAIAGVFEIGTLRRKCHQATAIKFLWWGVLAVPALCYIVGAPLVSALWEATGTEASNVATKDPNWTIAKEMSFRAAKFLVFAIFTYLGACIGSFLNVVAYCVPRGESAGLRDSSCPQCKTKIRRMDNLPIFSYINLAARCRSCQVPIPARYLMVELLVAAIFGSLFLYQLVTGAANVPSMNNVHYSGILWIILYPKWNIIGIYFFHSLFMSMLVVLALIEWDRQKLALRHSIAIVLPFLIAATVLLPLQPIQAVEFVSSLVGHIPAIAQLGKLVIGAGVGAAVASCLGAMLHLDSRSTFIPAMTLAGIVLGWQSVLHVSILLALMLLLIKLVTRLRDSLATRPTFVLLAAVMIHHPIWKIVFERISF
jgi:leader peptidase (prepilin peptidase)/N-methyltransferase